MATGDWCLIESDPGVFTDLIHGFGADGVQVEEIFSLDDDSLEQMKPCHGLIFLFKWQQTDTPTENLVKDSRLDEIFFARQVITNACATQAIVSVLLNCTHEDLKLGSTLAEFKEFAQAFDPQMRGLTLSNSDKIRDVHNSFARQQLFEFDSRDEKKDEDAFHFIAYIPFKGRLYELDGLQEAPIDHGAIPNDAEWTDIARPIVQQRMQKYSEGEIHFSLMAVISELRRKYERELEEILANPALTDDERNAKTSHLSMLIHEEERKRESYRIENLRRRHNWLPFIVELIKAYAAQGSLTTAVDKAIVAKEAEKKRETDKKRKRM
jgi:ubiquitin carboxyl-terminal hydrolase L5